MASPNIANLSSIVGVTSATLSVSPTSGSIVLNTPATNHVYKINTVMAANKTATTAYITLTLNRNATTWYTLAYQMPVPANASIVLMGKDNPLYMMDTQSDILSATTATASAIDVFVSYEDIS